MKRKLKLEFFLDWKKQENFLQDLKKKKKNF